MNNQELPDFGGQPIYRTRLIFRGEITCASTEDARGTLVALNTFIRQDNANAVLHAKIEESYSLRGGEDNP